MKDRIPLGFIELENGVKPIYALYDFFLNFTFKKKENWEDLRLIVNILLDAYMKRCPATTVTLIEDEILVTTQFEQYLNNLPTPKKQDFRIEEINIEKFTFVEVQNNASTNQRIKFRATEYSVLSISKNPENISNQIWLLAEDVQELLHGNAFSNYVPIDEVSGKLYPNASGIMFISLRELSEEQTIAGELASFLLGKTSDVKNAEVKRIADTLKKSCDEFCADKEVKKSMSVMELKEEEARSEGYEKGLAEGKAEGLAEGLAEGKAEGLVEGKTEGLVEGKAEGLAEGMQLIVELMKSGLQVEEAMTKINNDLKKQSQGKATGKS